MHLVARLKQSPLGNAVRVAQRTWNWSNDLALGIQTLPRWFDFSTFDELEDSALQEARQRAQRHDPRLYDTPDYAVARQILRRIATEPDDVFFDLGCGKGRMVCLMARRTLKRVIGVEISAGLCEMARRNVEQLRGRKTQVDIVHQDAAKTDLSQGTIFYLFNPFGAGTLNDVCCSIQATLAPHPRSLQVIYDNPCHEEVLARTGWLEKTDEFVTSGAKRVSFWKYGL